MKVYVLHDDPMEDMTTVYGVFKYRNDAVNKAIELYGKNGSEYWQHVYKIKEVELK